MDYGLLLQHYGDYGRKFTRAERLWFAQQPSLDQAIDAAARAVDSRGKRYRHQSRIRLTAIAQAKVALLQAKQQIAACTNFDELFNAVGSALRGIEWLGELYYYDTALRLGFYRGITPTKVYLHAGARDGARALGLDHKAAFIAIGSVPKQLRHLKPYEIEDFFCIYKDKVIRSICAR